MGEESDVQREGESAQTLASVSMPFPGSTYVPIWKTHIQNKCESCLYTVISW